MKTILMTDVVNMFGLVPPRILPDHSILSGAFVTTFYEFGKNFENLNSNKNKNSDNQQLPNKTNKKPKTNQKHKQVFNKCINKNHWCEDYIIPKAFATI